MGTEPSMGVGQAELGWGTASPGGLSRAHLGQGSSCSSENTNTARLIKHQLQLGQSGDGNSPSSLWALLRNQEQLKELESGTTEGVIFFLEHLSAAQGRAPAPVTQWFGSPVSSKDHGGTP